MLSAETRENLTDRFIDDLQQVLDHPDLDPGTYILDSAVTIGSVTIGRVVGHSLILNFISPVAVPAPPGKGARNRR